MLSGNERSDGMPNRILKESICRSEEIDSLSWFEEVLFYRLIVICDDFGRYDGRAKIIKGSCFPLKSITEKDINKALERLSAVGLVRVYEAQGRPYLQLVTWADHQRIRNQKSKFPEYTCDCKLLLPFDSKGQQKFTSDNKCVRNPIQSKSESESNAVTVSDDTVCRTDVMRAVEAWNGLEVFGIKKICKLSYRTKRYESLKARIKQYGIEEVLVAIDKVKHSDFLLGRNKQGWTITFDWFILPNNFPKVHDGNYDGNTTQAQRDKGGTENLSQFADRARRWAESE